jgi:uncharacterized protein YbjT (DUF2867 family)
MKIVVVGGSGLIGSKLVGRLTAAGHDAVSASPGTGVNALTGEGLAGALAGADVVVDVTNSPSFEAAAVLEFFRTSTTNLLSAERTAGVGHHVALSVVGCDGLPDSPYLVAKVAQERLIAAGGVPYTVLRATQFYEFAAAIIGGSTVDGTATLPTALTQPVAADDVAATLADVATNAPVNGVVNLGGPESLPLDEWARRYLAATTDDRKVVGDPSATYFGTALDDHSLRPGADARVGAVTLADWLSRG